MIAFILNALIITLACISIALVCAVIFVGIVTVFCLLLDAFSSIFS
jgi:hypothetical protein